MAIASRQVEVIIDEKRCRSCGICWEICPEGVLAPRPPSNKAEVVNLAVCTACRLCEWLCTDWAINIRSKVVKV